MKTKEHAMKTLKRFWFDLHHALIEAERMNVRDAASMIETRFDEYSDLRADVEASAEDNLYHRQMIDRAFAVRYMLDRAVSDHRSLQSLSRR
jgi:hypothetical protein